MSGPRTGKWMWTLTGRKFWITDPRPGDFVLEEIAHALALQCRFAGHVREPYSVAQHSVLVSEMCDPADAMEGLFHDSAEAYAQDIIRPLKYSKGMEGYGPIEAAVHKALTEQFGLRPDMPKSVSEADEAIVKIEMLDLMPSLPAHVRLHYAEQVKGLVHVDTIRPWPWVYAKEMWLARYVELGGVIP